MARQTYYSTRQQKHPLYRTRMLQAGQPLVLDAGAAALFGKMGVELSDKAPRSAAAPAPAPVKAEAPAAPKAAPKKKAARAKKKA